MVPDDSDSSAPVDPDDPMAAVRAAKGPRPAHALWSHDLDLLLRHAESDTLDYLSVSPARARRRGPGRDRARGMTVVPRPLTYDELVELENAADAKELDDPGLLAAYDVDADGRLEASHPGGATSWRAVDLSSVAGPDATAILPQYLTRDDGLAIVYAGKIHALVGPSESGKSLLAMLATKQVLLAGGQVVYIDFEDEATTAVARLLEFDVPWETLTERFHYVRPDEPFSGRPGTDGRAETDLLELVIAQQPQLVVLDGVTEGMGLDNLDPLSNNDVAIWYRMLPRRIAAHGPAVVMIDHVTKATEGRGRYAIGAQHKLSGIDGSVFTVDIIKPFRPGGDGRAKVTVSKDRPGAVRAATDGREHVADLVLSQETGLAGLALVPPTNPVGTDGRFRPRRSWRRSPAGSRSTPDAPSATSEQPASAGPNTSGSPSTTSRPKGISRSRRRARPTTTRPSAPTARTPTTAQRGTPNDTEPPQPCPRFPTVSQPVPGTRWTGPVPRFPVHTSTGTGTHPHDRHHGGHPDDRRHRPLRCQAPIGCRSRCSRLSPAPPAVYPVRVGSPSDPRSTDERPHDPAGRPRPRLDRRRRPGGRGRAGLCPHRSRDWPARAGRDRARQRPGAPQ